MPISSEAKAGVSAIYILRYRTDSSGLLNVHRAVISNNLPR